jgi:catechol 2,3-dioxygenase-like lactoylglutathione lyase family enzyme
MQPDAVPGLAYVDHIGISVPDLNTAVSFFCSVLGATELYRSARSGQGDFMRETFEVEPEASFELSMLKIPPNLNLELFQWSAPTRRRVPPSASDVGGHHVCIYVDDIDAAYAYLSAIEEVRMLGPIKTVPAGSPVSGTRWTYFCTPWGLQMELVNRAAVVDEPGFVSPRTP